jgi:hypothetical protein
MAIRDDVLRRGVVIDARGAGTGEAIIRRREAAFRFGYGASTDLQGVWWVYEGPLKSTDRQGGVG